jgi:integrase
MIPEGKHRPKIVGKVFQESQINHHVKEVLDALPRHLHHDFVFTYNDLPIVQNFRKSLRSACKDAGITFGRDESGGFVFHDIRSTVKTNMLRAGLDKAMRDVILGHSLKGMDAYYL